MGWNSFSTSGVTTGRTDGICWKASGASITLKDHPLRQINGIFPHGVHPFYGGDSYTRSTASSGNNV